MKIVILFVIQILITLPLLAGSFLEEQLKYKKVKEAYSSKSQYLNQELAKLNLSTTNVNILIMAFKHEQELFVFLKNKSEKSYKLGFKYNICASSGKLGPKRQQGDYQVPEGFYSINVFNPFSYFHLSLGINYPNKSDRILSSGKDPGGSIFIHGECVTIGCLPMTNDIIKELYILSVFAKSNGQSNIPVYIFPYNFSSEANKLFREKNKNDISLLGFWENLEIGYNKFHLNYEELKVNVDKYGNYDFK